MAEKQSSRDRLKDITASIEDGIKELFQSESYAQYLQTMSRFHHYSVNNQVLIHMQKPDATLVAGFNKWKNQFGRNVIKGEHGIKIIAPTPFKKKIEQEKLDPDTQLPMLDADGKIITEEKTIQIPMYKPVTVFDVSQTEGKPLPQLAHELSGNVANYDVFMEALRRSSPVPISIEVMGGGMDGYFDLEHQDIAIRKGMSEVQTVSAVIHEMAHALLHNRTKDTEEKTPELSRSTEEVQAESISYAVCAYYGIATGDNSFGYIASWSKDKTLPELRESLEVISKTADGLINDIDRHYAEILKEREEELIATEPAMAMERLYAVDERYLHVQRTDTGVDYTIYDKASMKEIDGGQLDMEISTLAEAALEICNSHGIGQNAPLQVADIGILDELQAAQDAAIAIEPPVQENPEPETGIPPDPAISVEARNAYGYTDDAMLPLTKERAMEMFERDVPVYLLYGDNTEAMAFEKTEILNHDGIFGIDRADWEAVKEQFPVITENRWQKAFQQNPADSYCIYQLRRDPELAELRFMNSHYLREHGLEPAFDHYEAVYSGSLPSDGSTEARLDDLYMKFNTAHPQDFTGHSLSVSDIVVLRQHGAVSSHYVDSVGFVQLPAFLPDNYLKNAEISVEDDYGMIDGIINNGSKEQPDVKPKAPDLSALFEAARQVVQEDMQAPEPGKKPSVLAMLHAPAPPRSEKSAQTKSAERDMI
ncbi:YodL domain-containing protein [Butyricicoccus porcorum]|uniref:YodL domain-containing protein n=1 Tax=Butyricicoccus porcorum TaxID=1945634 RepID=UPI003F4AA518